MSLYPLFIVGSPRSGTSILMRALQRGGYFGFNEGNFLSLIRTVERDVDRHFDVFGTTAPKVLTSQIDRVKLKEALCDVIAAAAAKHQAISPWMDKTGNPEMIEAIPTLRRIWPASRFLFAKRRAIENIVSRIKKFPGHNFEYHCADWARNMAAWRAQRAADPGLPGLDVDQHDINKNPAGTAARIGEFLQLGRHAIAVIEQTFTSERPQQTEPGSADRVLCLDALGWSAPQLAAFHKHCMPEMEIAGYTTDASYFRQG